MLAGINIKTEFHDNDDINEGSQDGLGSSLEREEIDEIGIEHLNQFQELFAKTKVNFKKSFFHK